MMVKVIVLVLSVIVGVSIAADLIMSYLTRSRCEMVAKGAAFKITRDYECFVQENGFWRLVKVIP